MPTTTTGSIVYFKDDLGQPLIGGKVYTYEYSTSKPKDIYKTAVRELPHTNPVILNDSGSVEWYLKGDYTIRVYTSEDVFVEEFSIVTPSKVQADEVSDSLNLLKSEIKNAAYRDTGTEPNQIPLNSNLGTAAYNSFSEDANGFIRKEGSTSEVVIKDAAGVAAVNGIQAGIGAPKIAYKKFTGTTLTLEAQIAHDLSPEKILNVSATVLGTDGGYYMSEYHESVKKYSLFIVGQNIVVRTAAGASVVKNRPIEILITYEV